MKLASFEAIVQALNAAEVRYLIAGGLAVNAHGYVRFTKDVDIVIALDTDNILGAFKALATLGYKPTVPITAAQFADAALRQRWIDEKNMKVLNFFSDTYRETPVDLFVFEPFEFETEHSLALQGELLPDLIARFVSIPTLIRMKEAAGRARDLDDIEHLRMIQQESARGG
ncbi:MAG TPA: hypothetical protein VF200_03230 [Woeseiaceae bacterium]